MIKSVSHRLSSVFTSDIRTMTNACVEAGGINLGQGLCDLPVHPRMIETAVHSIQKDKATYTPAEGILPLRRAIAEKLKRDNGIDADPECEIIVTSGTTGAFATVMMGLFDPGDEIVLFEPYYGYHLNSARLAGATVSFCPLSLPDLSLDVDALSSCINERTKAILLCTPSNPCGKVFTKEELLAVGEIAEKHDLLLITDEIYEYYCYEGHQHLSPASLPELKSRTVSMMGASKSFSVTGWRLGYVVAPKALATSIKMVNDIFYVCAPAPLQYALAESILAEPSYFSMIAKEHQQKRDLICGTLKEIGLTPLVPDGAYYVLADIEKLACSNSFEAAMKLLKTCGVAAIPGRSFFQSAKGDAYLRFCYSVENHLLEEACQRLQRIFR